jgi:hypothetical protein
MKEIDIQDLVPQGATIKLSKTGKEYKLNPVTLADDVWAQQNFGRGIDEIMASPKNVDDTIRVLYRLMTIEGKEEFKKQKVKFIDDKGEELVTELGGSDLLMHFVSGGKELYDIGMAILQTLGFSRPILEQAEQEELKKKSNQVSASEPTGESFLTCSATSTAGQPSISSAAP